MKKLILSLLFCLMMGNWAWAVTAFNVSVMPSGGDYTTLEGIFSSAGTINLTSATKVFSISSLTGTMANNTAVTGATSGATGTCVHAGTVNNQILIKTITGTFQSGEQVYESAGVNYVTLSNAGDSASLNVIISGTWASFDTAPVTIQNITTNSTNTILITATGTARQNGVWQNTGAYTIAPATGATTYAAIYNYCPYVTIDGLQIYRVSPSNNFNDGIITDTGATAGVYITNNIIRMNPGSGTNLGGIVAQGSSSANVWNNLIYNIGFSDSSQSGVVANGPTALNFYNNTVIGFALNIQQLSGTMNITNNICQSSGSHDYAGTFNTTATNISQDASSPNTANRSKTLTFVNTSAKNYALASTDTAAILQGTSLYSTFTTDITGTTRQASGAWDIGAFKYAGSATVNHGFTRFL